MHEDSVTGDEINIGPENTANLGFRYSSQTEDPTDHTLGAMAWLTFFDDTEFLFSPGGEVDDYVLLNGSVSYNFPIGETTRGTAFVKGFNFLDNDHLENPQGAEFGAILQVGFEINW